MSRQKDTKKKKHDRSINDNESTNQLFTDVDAKSVEISGYTLGHGAPQIDGSSHEYSLPTGVADMDESVVLPSSLSSFQHYQDPTSYTTSQTHERKHVHLPPINHHHHQQQHYPYVQPAYYHPEYFYHPHPAHHTHHSSHRKYQRHGETHDPRWWYMPLNSVHGPKSRRPPAYHYVPPKWYELPNRQ